MTSRKERSTANLMGRAARLAGFLMWPMIGAVVATVVATVARLVGPLAVRSGIDNGMTPGDRGMITWAAIIYFGVMVAQYLSQRTAQ